MRSIVLAALVLSAVGCAATPSARHATQALSLTSADSARITAAFLSGGAGDSTRYLTLRELLVRRDSLEAAANANPRRYTSLRVF
jgi:hypothetical protein